MSYSSTVDDYVQFRLQLYKKRAQERGRDFTLDYAQFKALLLSDCFYCGLPSDAGSAVKKGKDTWRCNGVDRVDSQKGYTPDNVVTSCVLCNFSKCDDDQTEWLAWIHAIAERTSHLKQDMSPELRTKTIDRKRARAKIAKLRT